MNSRKSNAGEGNWILIVIGAVVLLLLAVPVVAKLRPAGATSGNEPPAAEAAPPPPATGALQNPGFEKGQGIPTGWLQGSPVDGVEYLWAKGAAHTGQAALGFRKTAQRYWPIAEWSQYVQLPPGVTKIDVSAWVKAESAQKAVIDIQWNGGHQWATYIGAKNDNDPPANHDWQQYTGTVDLPPGTTSITVALQLYGPGTVYFDDLKLEPKN